MRLTRHHQTMKVLVVQVIRNLQMAAMTQIWLSYVPGLVGVAEEAEEAEQTEETMDHRDVASNGAHGPFQKSGVSAFIQGGGQIVDATSRLEAICDARRTFRRLQVVRLMRRDAWPSSGF